MSSQIYSRYVPPKKPAPALPRNTLPAKVSNPTLETLPPPTRHDASSTYARYVPSKPKSISVPQDFSPVIEASPSPKRKRDEDNAQEPRLKNTKKEKRVKSSTHAEPQSIDQAQDDDAYKEKEISLPKSKRKKQKSEIQSSEDAEAGDHDSRHKKLISKRDKSLKKAEKLLQRSKEEADEEEEEVAPEEPLELHDLVPLPQPEPVPEPSTISTESTLPTWLASPIRISPHTTASFLDIGVSEDVVKILQSKGFQEAFAVQAAVLPLLLPGKAQQPGDILVSAATGSGKTLSYVLPMIESISRNQTTKLRGLIVMPTRELVSQAREVSKICASAFSSGNRKRLKIGTAVGSEAFKVEQSSLMEQELFYDPEKYNKQQERLNSKWESSEGEEDDDELLCGEEMVSTLPDHIINWVPRIDILICTPGRLVEHLKSTPGFNLEHLKWLVVDEADKLLDQSFQQWLAEVMKGLQRGSENLRQDRIQKIILSATMTRDIGQLNHLKLYRPKLVVLDASSSESIRSGQEGSQSLALPSLLEESGTKVDDEGIKPLYLLEILRREKLLQHTVVEKSSDTSSDSADSDSDSSDSSSDDDTSADERSHSPVEKMDVDSESATSVSPRGVLIFTKSNESAVRLGRLISLLEPNSADFVGTLTSTTRSSVRKTVLKAFESKKLSILVASDLVSRGLDLPNLAHVINYDMPTSVASYVHRVGRTARAGKVGQAWTLFTATEGRWFWNEIGRSPAIERTVGSQIKRVNINTTAFDDSQRRKYEAALEELGRQAGSSQQSKSS